MKVKIYASDEGFGPIVRQNAIIDEMLRLNKNLFFTFQSEKNLPMAKKILNINFIDRFNNIIWYKRNDGSPDVEKISNHLFKYPDLTKVFIEKELKEFDYDFIISDFVPEAFYIAKQKNVPSFGIAHFTWDWFFSKLVPSNKEFISLFDKYVKGMDVIYFPPFTPKEVLDKYADKAKIVPLIIKRGIEKRKIDFPARFRVLIMDSGSGVLHGLIKNNIPIFKKMDKFQFFLSSSFDVSGNNITTIDKNELFVNYIPIMDVVIGRAGFNTTTECIAHRTPFLMLSENLNPEMEENIKNLSETGLCGKMSINDFTSNFENAFMKFIDEEYDDLLYNMKAHNMRIDGAKVIAQDILERVNKWKNM